MRRVAAGLAVCGLAGLAALWFWQGDVLPSYLASWLFWMAFPLGALPVVAGAELVGAEAPAMLPVLRRMLLMLPLGAVLATPLLLGTAPLFHHAALSPHWADWMGTPALVLREAVLLLVWSALALLLARPRRGMMRNGLGALALALHMVMASVAAVDWVLALTPGLNSSAIGLLLILVQAVTASSAALFVVAVRARDALPDGPAMLLVSLLGGWAFLHFTQYLVIWSADLPAEIVWYQRRAAGLGGVLIWSEAAITLSAVALLSTRLRHVPAWAASATGALLCARLLEALWLVTPAFRAGFTISAPDLVALVGVGGLCAGLFVAVIGAAPGASHAPG